MRAYSADTALFAEEEQFIENQLAFVAHYASTITLPKAWTNHPILSQMVEYYNFMSFAHAIETDLDAYFRYEDEVEEGETDYMVAHTDIIRSIHIIRQQRRIRVYTALLEPKHSGLLSHCPYPFQ